MPLKTQHWIGIGGAAALLGYLLFWPKQAKAATGPAKPSTPSTPSTPKTEIPKPSYPTTPPEAEVSEARAYDYDPTLWTETELEKKYAKGEDVSAPVASLGKSGYADGLKVGSAAANDDVKAYNAGTLGRPLGAETNPSFRARMDDPNLATPYKEGFNTGFNQAYDGIVSKSITVKGVVGRVGCSYPSSGVKGSWHDSGMAFVPDYWKGVRG